MTSSIHAVSLKRAALNRKRAKFVRLVLAEVPYCEARLANCTRRSTDVHEILTRARGGSVIDRKNVAALCRRCHAFITVNPAWSALNGWMLSSWSTEADAESARLKRRERLLADKSNDEEPNGRGGLESVA
ncbi:MAG TPA: HNH endonuclease signature motif containing protein [Acidimicrobiales bacterium]|nr:HNH endonuclease signature motif containing protein [Acidimicrobiales bacterium]